MYAVTTCFSVDFTNDVESYFFFHLEQNNQSSKSATIEMYAPSSYNDTVTGETLSSVSEKSETYSNEGSGNDYVVRTKKKNSIPKNLHQYFICRMTVENKQLPLIWWINKIIQVRIQCVQGMSCKSNLTWHIKLTLYPIPTTITSISMIETARGMIRIWVATTEICQVVLTMFIITFTINFL